MIFHILINHRHIVTFLANANKFFDSEKHRYFLIPGEPQGFNWLTEMKNNSRFLHFTESLNLRETDCVVLHSLFIDPKFLEYILELKARVGFRLIWSTWGADFLSVIENRHHKIFSYFDSIIVNRSAFQSSEFPTNVIVDNDTKFYLDSSLHESKNSIKDTILIGNSGDPSNNHLDILYKLNTSLKICIPLSYNCPKEYRDEILHFFTGGERLIILDEVLDSRSYIRILDSVRLVVYGHNRQQGIHTARMVYQLGGNICLKKMITDSSGTQIVNPGYVALFETGCPDLIDFDRLDEINDDFLNDLVPPRRGSFFSFSWQSFYFRAFEDRWFQ